MLNVILEIIGKDKIIAMGVFFLAYNILHFVIIVFDPDQYIIYPNRKSDQFKRKKKRI